MDVRNLISLDFTNNAVQVFGNKQIYSKGVLERELVFLSSTTRLLSIGKKETNDEDRPLRDAFLVSLGSSAVHSRLF